jgi:N-acetylglucosamine-6-sulfatase
MRMPRVIKSLASVGLSMGVASSLLLLWGVTSTMPRKARAATGRPNIVFILTDDMRKDDLRYMPKTRALLKDKGVSFENAFVSHALCSPSRATIMRGQYAHNTHVFFNNHGLWTYRSSGGEQDNVATRLDAAGYRTGLFGKYFINGVPKYVPQGWDRWFGLLTLERYFDYDVNDDGAVRHYGTRDDQYLTDVLRRKTERFIGASVARGEPFFAYVAPHAPHMPATPAPRDAHAYDGLKAPRLPSFDEKDLSDKPLWIRQLPRLRAVKKAAIDERHEKRAESLQAVDDLVAGVVGKLRNMGVLSNTYIFFTSDNGWHEGEHRIKVEKWRPYEEDVHMPLLVRGPGIAAGSTTYKLALNTDYMPTFTDLACPTSTSCDTQNWSYEPDGRSLRPVLEKNATPWRSAILLEAARHYSPAYRGIRTSGGTKYMEYASGDKELYRLGRDPYELRDKYPATRPSAGLVSRLHALKTCAADSCRTAENTR